MLGVLEVVLRHDAIAGGVGVAGELLVALVNVLGGAAHLDAIGAVGIEGAIGVGAGAVRPHRRRSGYGRAGVFIPLKSLIFLS